MHGSFFENIASSTRWLCLRTLPAVTPGLGTSNSMHPSCWQGCTRSENHGMSTPVDRCSFWRFVLGSRSPTPIQATLSSGLWGAEADAARFTCPASLAHGNGKVASWRFVHRVGMSPRKKLLVWKPKNYLSRYCHIISHVFLKKNLTGVIFVSCIYIISWIGWDISEIKLRLTLRQGSERWHVKRSKSSSSAVSKCSMCFHGSIP